MRTDEQTWVRETFEGDEPPYLGTLDGHDLLDRGRAHRRRQRVLGAAPLAATAGLVLGAALWAGDVLPGSQEDVREGAGAGEDWRATCPAPEEGAASYDAGAPYGTYTVLDDVPDVEPLLGWTTSTGVEVTVLPTLGPCLAEFPRDDMVGIAVLARPVGGPTVLAEVQDVEARTAEDAATFTGSGWLEGGVAVLPPYAVEAEAVGAEMVGELTPVVDETGTVVAQVVQVGIDGDVLPTALTWRQDGESPDWWSLAWTAGDLRANVEDISADMDTSAWPQLNHTSGDEEGWWLWLGGPDAAGPITVPDGGPWVMRLSSEELGSVFVGWVPEGTESYLVDGQEPTAVLPLKAVEVEPGDPDPAPATPGLMPVAVESYTVVDELDALAADGTTTPIPVIDVDLEQMDDGQP